MNQIHNSIRLASPARFKITKFSACCIAFALMTCGCNLGAQHRNVAGRQAYENGQSAAAINQFQQAMNLNPRNADAYYNLGASYYSLGKQQKNQQWIQQAEQLYRQAIALDDRHTEAHRGLASLLIESGQEKFAFDLMNDWKNRYANSPEPVIELARLYQEYGDNRRATDLLADALRLDGQSVRALKAMGHIREVQGQTHLALDNYLRVLQLDGQQTDVAARVASLQTQLAQLPIGPNQSGQPVQQPRYGSINPYLPR
jgi:tetratricopeptide (TPR) repeat protein